MVLEGVTVHPGSTQELVSRLRYGIIKILVVENIP